MKKLTTLLVATAAAMYFTGCGDAGVNANNGIMGNNTSSSSTGDKTGDSDTEKKGDYDESVEFTDELPKCTAKKDGKVYYVEDEDITYTCNYDEDLKTGEWVKSKKKPKKPVADETIESGDDLPKCNDKSDGDIYYIEEDDVYVTCDSDEGKWIEVDTDPETEPDTDKSSSSKGSLVDEKLQVTYLSNLPTCKSSLEFVTYYVLAEDEDYTCFNGLWYNEYGDTYPETEPSSSSNGGGEIVPEINSVASLSSLPTCTSRIEETYYYVTSEDDYYYCSGSIWVGLISGDTYPKTEPSSSSAAIITAVCGDMWCGPRGEEQVLTGLDAGAGESGWWWEYDDNAVSDEGTGNSQFGWYPGKGNDFSESSFLPIIEYNGGVAGTAYLDPGTRTNAFLGVGFNIAGGTTAGGGKVGVDATSWEGICVVYTSTGPLTVLLGLTDSEEAYYEYDLPVKHLTASTSQKVVNILWSAFKQDGWAGGYSISGTEAASQLGAIKFQFDSEESDYITFNIQSIGTYGSCE
ncbi:MAG: hypothetical protein IKS02_01355 [Fibrobacter sp.]|nr:hypothetical protein [Fibrobacter sp.]